MSTEQRTCDECGTVLQGTNTAGRRSIARFCGSMCKRKYNNRRATRGSMIYDLAMRWRKDRRKEDLTNLCHQLGLFISQDTADGRTSFNRYDNFIPWQVPQDNPTTGEK